jgi:hypothetical protein
LKRFYKFTSLFLIFMMLLSFVSCGAEGLILPPHQHKYTYTVYPSSCSRYGYIEYDCACKHTYRENLTELASHEWTQYYVVDKQATFASEGVKSYHCLNCDARTGITSIPKLETDLPFIPT